MWPCVWLAPERHVIYVLWHDSDTYQVITEDGPDGERHALPGDAVPLTRGATQMTGHPG